MRERAWGFLLLSISILAIASYFVMVLTGLTSLALLIVTTFVVLAFFGFTAWVGMSILTTKWPEE